jgi:hypothetical protein
MIGSQPSLLGRRKVDRALAPEPPETTAALELALSMTAIGGLS